MPALLCRLGVPLAGNEALLLALLGVGAGLPLVFGAIQLIESQLYGISPLDPAALGAVSMLLFSIALLAAWLPARRAARISPLEALRAE